MIFVQVEANFILLHNEPLVRRGVVQPWVACAARRDCMCPPDHSATLICDAPVGPNQTQIGLCNRFDQSALTTILSKMFREALYHVVVPIAANEKVHYILRGDGNMYLADLDQKKIKILQEGKRNG